MLFTSSALFARTVTVGYYAAPGMMNGAADDGEKSGYAYDYIQALAEQAGWRFQYVYGNFGELYEKLRRGEIDMLPYVTKTETREKEVLFPRMAMGEERIFLGAKKPGRLSGKRGELRGKRIGLIKGAFFNQPVKDRFGDEDVAFAEFGLAGEAVTALERGEIDYIVELSTAALDTELYSVCEIDARYPFHIAVARGNPDLLREVESAHEGVGKKNPAFLHELERKYFRGGLDDVTVRRLFRKHPEYAYAGVSILLLAALVAVAVAGRAKARRIKDRIELARVKEARRVAEDANRRNEALNRILKSGQWYCRLDADDRIVEVRIDDDVRKLVDNDVSDAEKGWIELIHPDDADAARGALHAAIADHSGKTPYDAIFRMRDRGGDYRWFRSAGRIFRDADGSGEFIGAIIDITDTVQRRDEARKLDRQYDKLLHETFGASRWAYEISRSGEVTAARYGERIIRYLGGDGGAMDWLDNVHPDDRKLAEENFMAAVRDPEGKTPYEVSFRLKNADGTMRWVRSSGRIVLRDDGTRDLIGLSLDITDTIEEQKKRLLGAVPVSPDMLAKEGIGLWAFELDEGQPPRMYHDETMLKLVGLDHQLPPEEAYHAWYDRVDKDCYQLVHDAVAKMMAGEHAEVQYPWHHPDGHTMIVRCGGVRNPGYTKGIRVEGSHQDVSGVLHYDDAEIKRLKAREVELMHAEFRASAIAYVTEHEGDVKSFLNFFADRLRRLIECDQVIYRGAKGEVIVSNSPELGKDFALDQELCRRCPRFNMRSPIYKDGVVEIADMDTCAEDTRAPAGCPVKSSLVRIVNLDGKANGYLTIHYILGAHAFTDDERKTLEEFANLLSLSLSKLAARETNAELQRELQLKRKIEEQQKRLEEALAMAQAANTKLVEQKSLLDYFVGSFSSAYSVNLAEETFEVLHMSHEFSQVFGENGNMRDGMLKFIENHVHPDDRSMMLQMIDRDYVRNRLKTEAWFSFTVREVFGSVEKTMRGIVVRGGDIDHVAVGFTDITEELHREQTRQRQLQDALQAAQAANRAKTEFLFNMSHDIRTPMNAIAGFTEIARKSVNDAARVSDCLDKIDSSGTLLLALINNVLDMSRIESGNVKLNEVEADIFDSFLGVVTIMTEQAKRKDISISFDFGSVRDRYVYADCDRGTRIFVNLISNAIKYTPNGGSIRIGCEQIEKAKGETAKAESPDAAPERQTSNLEPQTARTAWYRYTFADTGIGMSEEFQHHLFEQFTREQNSTTSGIQGTGLGLAITKDIIDLMGGTISCKSKRGEGTTFTVELPFRVREQTAADGGRTGENAGVSDASQTPQPFKGKRVLLVEDNELNREVAEFVLQELGFEVESAEDGSVAVARVKEVGLERYDCILMDIQMPIMGGYEATKTIRALEREWKGKSEKEKGKSQASGSQPQPGASASHIPIIALSANAFEEDRKASLAAGMDGHVAKPIKVSELLQAMMLVAENGK